jgi:signal transduction histidine kinase
MNLKPRHTYALFGLAGVAVVSILAWLSVMTVRLDRERTIAKQRAVIEENVRLALWRMDSSLATLLSEEGSRPHFVYRPFVSRATDTSLNALLQGTSGDGLVPSPLLRDPPPQVFLHFQYEPPRRRGLKKNPLTSPQVPGPGQTRRLPKQVSPESLKRYAKRLEQLRGSVPKIQKFLLERRRNAKTGVEDRLGGGQGPPKDPAQYSQKAAPQQQDVYDSVVQSAKNVVEWGRRSTAVRKVSRRDKKRRKQAKALLFGQAQSSNWKLPGAVEGAMSPAWVDDKLLLIREVRSDTQTFAQGAWLDWDAIADELRAEVADLFPNARLVPAKDTGTEGRRLAALPARLVVGDVAPADADVSASVLLTLVVAWSGAALATIGLGLLLLGITALSERRADFVSAVTHELRTPLTTFRMYTEMLSEDMVTDPDKRKQYLRTLQLESIRLGHLVENVLSYARIERGREGGQRERLSLREVIDHFAERLEARALQANMQLVVELPADTDGLVVHADRGAIEQILYNLVDNATKYAATAQDLRIHIHAEARGRHVHLSVSDHGPGIPRDISRTLFAPFSKSAERAALSAPGVGLGLALSRRLARAMGGDLIHTPSPVGARFNLRLPRD